MKVGVLSRSQNFWSTTQILKALRQRGVKPHFIHTPDVHLSINEAAADLLYNGKSLRDFDIFIPRIGRSLTQLGSILLNQFELVGKPTTLSMRGLLTARNKFLALQALHRAKVPVPASMLIGSKVPARIAAKYMPPPVVLKLLAGTQGVGVMRVRSVKEAGQIIDTLTELDQLICLQKYLPNPGEDIRVFVVGGHVVAAMKRKAAAHEWRSNIHMGGKGLPHKPSKEEKEIAVRAAEAVGVEIAGIDMITADAQPYVIEVNASPGFQGLLKATGHNAADDIADYTLNKAKS